MSWSIGWFFKTLSFLVVSLPGPIKSTLGNFLGWLWFDVFRIRRQIAIDNIQRAYPEWSDESCVRLARKSAQHMGQTIVEYCQIPFLTEARARELMVIEGEENVRLARERGKGVFFLTLHLGNGDLVIAGLSRLGWPLHLISKEFKLRWLNKLWFGMRRRQGTNFISPEKSSFDILRVIRRNEIVIFVLDQFMGPPVGVRTRFFGRETGTAAGLALMAIRTGAAVIPCHTFRRGDGRHVLRFGEPIVHQDDSLREKNITVLTQIYTDKIESIVRQHPDQWMWIHRRWKEFRE